MGQLQKRAKDFVTYLNAKTDDLGEILPPGIDRERFVRSAHRAVLGNPDLLDPSVSRRSLYMAIADCALYGLFPDGKEAAIIPYRDRSGDVHPQFMPMRKGLVKKILQNPDYLAVRAEPVREEDEHFRHVEGLEPVLEHTPAPPPDDEPDFSPSIKAAYAIVRHRELPPQESPFKVVYRKEVEQARNTGHGNTPAWRNWYGEMACKVAIRRLAKDLILSDEAEELIRLDDRLEAGERVRPEDVRKTRGSGDGKLDPSEAAADASRRRIRELEGQFERASSKTGGDDEEDGPEPISEEDLDEVLPEGDSLGDGDDEDGDGPREPTEEEAAEGEEKRRENHLALIGAYRPADVLHAAEKLFGGADDVPTNDDGQIDVEALGVDRLSRLSDELADNYRPAEEQEGEDDGDED